MSEKLKDIKNKVLEVVNKVDVLKKLVEIMRANRMVTAIGLFCVIAIAVLLVSVLALQEFVVSVCILIVIEAAMAALLHNVELWKHGVLLAAQLVVGIILKNIPLVVLCVVIYVAATAALALMKEE